GCSHALVAPLYASSFTASSRYNFLYSPNLARLHGGSGWAPYTSDREPWLQINLGDKYKITSIATQGTYNTYDWVTKYIFLYGDSPNSWKPFFQQGSNWTFGGNRNTDGVVRHYLYYPIIAQYVRFIPVAWNPRGKIGLRLEIYGCTHYSDAFFLDGNSTITYRFKTVPSHTLEDYIYFNFKTLEKEGVLMHGEGLQGDYITAELQNAQLLLHINLGTSPVHSIEGHTTVTVGSLLDDQHWHYVKIERYGREVNFTLDGEVRRFYCNGDFDHMDLDSEVVFGGVIVHKYPSLSGKKNFRGCMENIIYNRYRMTSTRQQARFQFDGRVGFSCRDLPYQPITFAGINNYIQIPAIPKISRLSIKFKFRSWDTTGLLFFTSFAEKLGSLELYLSEGQVNVSITQSGNRRVEFAAGHRLNDGFWHSVEFIAREASAIVIIDEDEGAKFLVHSPFQLLTGDNYYFGGCPKNVLNSDCMSNLSAFHGCMQMISVDNEPLDLNLLRHRRLGRHSEVYFSMCGITNRCNPNLCEHEGICLQSWDDFICNCETTGYKGETCHKSVYKESCDAYRRSGKLSGNYTIDPDGSGPLRPFKVYCKITVERAWTIVHHNRRYETRVTGSSIDKPLLARFDYWNASWDEVSALANVSEYCEQKLEFSCYRSRLLNTPTGLPYSFWMGRNSERHFYWGGVSPGIQGCACGLDKNCADSRYYCNCDADYKRWLYDIGILNYRHHLPITQVVVGDTNRTGSEARFTAGPLRCYGDGSNWNTITFTKAAVLEFPTVNSTPSLDISLYFKTSASSGVFLENSGYWDFIRIELNTTTDVMFAFDVGDGSENLTLRAPTPLNDNEWHQVKAEINVKLARLRVDKLPWVVRQAPHQSYVHMRFNKPLFVGAAEHKLKPFIGCLRGLKMNGVTLNLEVKANETEGVKLNCTGHCSNPRVECYNAGRCIERYSHYTCDCNISAFDGPFCTKNIGGYFESGTWVRYNILSTIVAASKELASLVDLLNPGFNQTSEEIAFSFSTYETPAVLLYVSSYSQDYLAVILKEDGSLQLRYRLGTSPYVFTLTTRNLADGRPHIVNITRINRELYTQVDYFPVIKQGFLLWTEKKFNSPKALFLGRVMETGLIDKEVQKYNTPGFIGCLSGVRFNNIAPLKSFFRPNDSTSAVSVKGDLVESNCGAMPMPLVVVPPDMDPWYREGVFPYIHDDSLSGPLIALVVMLIFLLIIGLLVVLYLYFHRNKGSYHTNEPKPVESTSSIKPLSAKKDANLPQILEESKTE
uniref:Contactin associated protein 1 n=1 Tax=Latimeria chalumnae TaxID=7897 RepID=H3AW98_LATCH